MNYIFFLACPFINKFKYNIVFRYYEKGIMEPIEPERVMKSSNNDKVIDNSSFSMEPGEKFSLTEPNSAGKTTNLQMMLGIIGRLDVHTLIIKACIAHGPLNKPPLSGIKACSTMTSEPGRLNDWIKEYGVTAVAIESTGIYCKPFFNIHKDDVELVSANAHGLHRGLITGL